MEFSFKTNVTKEFILSKISQEAIFEYYLNLPVKKGLFKSPLRVDYKPTCSYFNKNGTIYFHDFATDDKLNCFAVVMRKYGCNFYTALEKIAKDFNLIESSTINLKAIKIAEKSETFEEKESSSIQITKQDFSKNELKWWESYGITSKILKKFGVYSCKYVFLNGKLMAESTPYCPIYGYYLGKRDDEELWRIYFPKRKQFRFLSNTSAKKMQGFRQLPDKGPILVITKSMKDTMCLYSMNIPSCSPNSETIFPDEKVIRHLQSRFKYIVVLFDNDRAGMYNMAKARRKYPELIYTIIPKDKAKDISDFYQIYGKKSTLELLKTFLKWLKARKKN